MITVLLVDDHELVRKGFRLMLDAQPDLTVKNHVHSLFAKIGVRDRAQAVIVAYEAALISPGE